jgi:putative hydrolase of the HAD superfamily
MDETREIKSIIFDAARVLMNFDTSIFAKSIASFSLFSEEEILLKIKESIALKEFDKGKIHQQDFYKELAGIIQLKDFSYEKFEAEWKKILFWSNEDLGKILSKMKPEIKLFVLANMDELSWEVFVNFPIIKKYFPNKNQRLASCEIGYAKPESDFYNEALKRFDVAANQSLFIDDNQENLDQVRALDGNIIRYDCRSSSIDYLHTELEKFNLFK